MCNVYLEHANLIESSFRSSILINCNMYNGLVCRDADFSNATINSKEFVKYLRQNGARNVPDPMTSSEEIRSQLAKLNYTHSKIDNICERLT